MLLRKKSEDIIYIKIGQHDLGLKELLQSHAILRHCLGVNIIR